MDNQKQTVVQAVKEATNVLVTVSSNPSVDQLASCIGLTLALNKMGKHATAVFSGAVPSTIEFLQPEKTLEQNTDSLRDFIIALDKSKADKLRYKVEDRVVKIFITPYKTSISDKDLEFSQGDFNVDVVVAIGVHAQTDLDQAITAHGRILHDATVITINTQPGGELGGINWIDAGVSSLSELVTGLVTTLDKKLIDTQIATALLTGIVAETNRFSNSRTTPGTMSIAAELMAAGANQQLVATKLEEPPALPAEPKLAEHDGHEAPVDMPKKPDDGTLEITHETGEKPAGAETGEAAGGMPDDQPAGSPVENPGTEPPHEDEGGEHPEDQKPFEGPKPAEEDNPHLKGPDIPVPEEPQGTEPPHEPADYHEAPSERHDELMSPVPNPFPPLPEPVAEPPEEQAPQIHIDEHGQLTNPEGSDEDFLSTTLPPEQKHEELHKSDRPYLAEPTTAGGGLFGMPGSPAMSAAVTPEGFVDPLAPPKTNGDEALLLDRKPLTPPDRQLGISEADSHKIMPPAEVVTPTVPPSDAAEDKHENGHPGDHALPPLTEVKDDEVSAPASAPVREGSEEPKPEEKPAGSDAGSAPATLPEPEHETEKSAGRELPKPGEPAAPEEAKLPEPSLPSVSHPAEPQSGDASTLSQIEKEVNSPHLSSLTPYEALGSEPLTHDGKVPEPAPPAADATTPKPDPLADLSSPLPAPSLTPSIAEAGLPPAPPAPPAPDAGNPQEPADDAKKDEQLPASPSVEDARSAVERAINAMAAANGEPGAEERVNSVPLGNPIQHDASPIKGATGIEIVPAEAPGNDHPADAAAPPPGPPPFPGA